MANLKLTNSITSEASNQILKKTKTKMGFVPNMYFKMGHNFALLDSYTHAYDSFRQHAGFTLIEQEVNFLSVAYENKCTYCMAAHSTVADKMAHVPTEITNAIRNNTSISDPKLKALHCLTRQLTKHRGVVSEALIKDFLLAGYKEDHVLGIITGIAVKTMSNYTNHNTHPQIDDMFSYRTWKPIDAKS